MKRNSIGLLLVLLLLGAAIGFAVSSQINRLRAHKTSALLREFSFPTAAADVTNAKWQVLEDRTYEQFPALAKFPRTARRVVAYAELSKEELEKFTAQFEQAATAALEKHGAVTKAQFDLTKDSTQIVNGAPAHTRIELPRRYYAIGDIQGVADIGYVEESGRVTVIVSLIEGL